MLQASHSARPVGQPKKDIDGKDQNILIVGNDDRQTATDAELAQLGTTRDGGSLNTDTMMVLHVPADGRKATVISIPRDSYVTIPGHGMNKINSAYPTGVNSANGSTSAGARLAVETVSNLTGLTIDHFVQVDLLGFYRISNAIGGVPVNLCAPAKEANSGINLPAGVSVIKGTQALAFVRQRYGFPDGLDNCPNDPNPTQADLDNDGKGDDCDGCPTFSNPGAAPCPPGLVINEVDYDQSGFDTDEFVEIRNGSGTVVNLAGKSLVLVNGANDTPYLTVDLSPAGLLSAGQYLVVRNSTVAVAGV